jgi:hypothetical protein
LAAEVRAASPDDLGTLVAARGVLRAAARPQERARLLGGPPAVPPWSWAGGAVARAVVVFVLVAAVPAALVLGDSTPDTELSELGRLLGARNALPPWPADWYHPWGDDSVEVQAGPPAEIELAGHRYTVFLGWSDPSVGWAEPVAEPESATRAERDMNYDMIVAYRDWRDRQAPARPLSHIELAGATVRAGELVDTDCTAQGIVWRSPARRDGVAGYDFYRIADGAADSLGFLAESAWEARFTGCAQPGAG